LRSSSRSRSTSTNQIELGRSPLAAARGASLGDADDRHRQELRGDDPHDQPDHEGSRTPSGFRSGRPPRRERAREERGGEDT
jgi:hypothetical protein